jgi:hypothetical protein
LAATLHDRLYLVFCEVHTFLASVRVSPNIFAPNIFAFPTLPHFQAYVLTKQPKTHTNCTSATQSSLCLARMPWSSMTTYAGGSATHTHNHTHTHIYTYTHIHEHTNCTSATQPSLCLARMPWSSMTTCRVQCKTC